MYQSNTQSICSDDLRNQTTGQSQVDLDQPNLMKENSMPFVIKTESPKYAQAINFNGSGYSNSKKRLEEKKIREQIEIVNAVE